MMFSYLLLLGAPSFGPFVVLPDFEPAREAFFEASAEYITASVSAECCLYSGTSSAIPDIENIESPRESICGVSPSSLPPSLISGARETLLAFDSDIPGVSSAKNGYDGCCKSMLPIAEELGNKDCRETLSIALKELLRDDSKGTGTSDIGSTGSGGTCDLSNGECKIWCGSCEKMVHCWEFELRKGRYLVHWAWQRVCGAYFEVELKVYRRLHCNLTAPFWHPLLQFGIFLLVV